MASGLAWPLVNSQQRMGVEEVVQLDHGKELISANRCVRWKEDPELPTNEAPPTF